MLFAENWWSVSVRRNRASFLVATLCLIAILAAVGLIINFFPGNINAKRVIFNVFSFATSVAFFFLAGQRLRDFNLTGLLVFIWIPIQMLPMEFRLSISACYYIVLCVVPGSIGPNRYGEDPVAKKED